MKKKIILILTFIILSHRCFAKEEKLHVKFCAEGIKFSVPFGKNYNYADIRVKRVIDGDTIELENGQKVRLIGIDAPEMHDSEKLLRDMRSSKKDIQAIKSMGRLSYGFLKELIENKRVRLEFDVERYDRYNRLLAYVFLKDDDTFVNAKLLEDGFVQPMTVPPNVKYADYFLSLYRKARQEKKGLWKEE
ncbi:MAG: thermonuclease family protein [Candidatus Omnitrophica bacterium]|nr:thermonuclease family protein [Candidatus Omnitrophota bacterium]